MANINLSVKLSVDELMKQFETLLSDDVVKISNAIKTKYTTRVNHFDSNFFNSILFFQDEIDQNVDNKFYLQCRGKRAIYIYVMNTNVPTINGFDPMNYASSRNSNTGTDFKIDDVLYVGKTNSLIKRTHNHFMKTLSSPGSLKLGVYPRNTLLKKFDIYAFILKDKYNNKYENMVLGSIESELHSILKPLVGTSRV